ncbi:hypothetical protein UFOVP1328_14 [uncultured Caudovirales phage]|uniref:Uncharacterized protein n=1 Tax=uncultured Caudovirales phage TaxID=2100421 RepID=A0A6J5QE26_9CAUD|nr:hypothetical protein UFOVP1084_2 [uncultured Caudovirales phage]CAB4199063.1 hypothetical protein UFOVP1328_14 [uncultured Caudovirales phage]CAB5228416.1 hypothetical protein UFOVP1532_45 [uncultured Caudovirales phage]
MAKARKKAVFKDKKPKDDGSRYQIVSIETGRPVFLPTEDGLVRPEAERLAARLLTPTRIVCIREPDAA